MARDQQELTQKQREALVVLLHGDRNAFDFGATTVAVLHKRGLIKKVYPSRVTLTEAGFDIAILEDEHVR